MILEHKLPTILTVDEIDRLLEAVDDIKYRAMFATMYSSGMRVSEVIHLHYDDISRSNMQIHVRDTKNRMDRYTILSKRCLDILTQYLLWSSIFVTLMANKIGGLQFGIYRNCQISSRVFHTAVAALPLTKANRSDFE